MIPPSRNEEACSWAQAGRSPRRPVRAAGFADRRLLLGSVPATDFRLRPLDSKSVDSGAYLATAELRARSAQNRVRGDSALRPGCPNSRG